MNILLIGHEGYLGRALMEYLSRGHKVLGWDKKEDLFNLNASVLVRNDIETVINLSLIADRQFTTYQIDTPTEEVNVMGARHIARTLKGSQIAWFQFSTREVLGLIYRANDVVRTDAGYRPKFLIDETYPYNPQNFYGKSKVVAEFISESHPYSNVIRLVSPYTDYDHPSAGVLLRLIQTVVQRRPVTLTHAGEQFRDPLHTDDLGRLMELLCEHKVFGEKIHAGGGEKNIISFKELVRRADPQAKIQNVEGGDYGFAFDIGKAFRLTGWEPKIQVREKIPVIVENVRSNRRGR